MIDIYTDGACKGNPGPAGWAALVGDEMISGAFSCSTNNYAELWAIHEAIRHVPVDSTIRIYTDSKCCINWITDRWRRHQPRIAGVCEAIHMLKEAKGLTCSIAHVHGHTGNPGNERVDKAASLEAAQAKARLAMERFIQEGTGACSRRSC